MISASMGIEEFEELLDLHGSDLSRWPPPRRAGAEALAAADPVARERLKEARRLDALLGAAMAVEEPMRLAVRVSEAVRRRRETGLGALFQWRWIFAAGSAATALGIGLGIWLDPTAIPDPDLLLSAAMGGALL